MNAEICIGVPVFNSAAYLRESLDRILEQTFRDFRILVWNDGSTDGSADILREYAAKDPRIHIVSAPAKNNLHILNRNLKRHAHQRSSPF